MPKYFANFQWQKSAWLSTSGKFRFYQFEITFELNVKKTVCELPQLNSYRLEIFPLKIFLILLRNAHKNPAMFLNGLRTVARLMKNNTIIICASCVKGYRGTVPQLCVRKELSNDAIPLICTFPLKLIDSTLDTQASLLSSYWC